MSPSRFIPHVYLTRSPYVFPARALGPKIRQIHHDVHGRHFVPDPSMIRTRTYEADSHSPKEYVIFALLLGSIGSYALYEFFNRDPAAQSSTPLNDRNFVPFLLVSKEPVSSTSSIYTLRRGSNMSKNPYAHLWGTKDEIKICSVEFKQPQLQIARAYTPLPPTEETEPSDLRFLIRKEKKGEVSNYLDGLRIGATVDVRGPRKEWQTEGIPLKVVFLAGGTGIAPAMQVAMALLDNYIEEDGERRRPKIHILWANRKREDCKGGTTKGAGERWPWPFSQPKVKEPSNLLVKELEDMVERSQGNLTIDYLVDEESTFIDRRLISRNLSTKDDPKSAAIGARLLIISGPDGFVEYLAGTKAIEGGPQVQGQVGGIIGQLGLKGWTVVKL